MQRRIMIGAFVLLALLFVLATAHRNGGRADLSHPGGFVGWLGHRFGGTPDADRADLSAPCLVQDKLEVHDGTCTVKVAKSGTGQRNVRLHSDSAVAVQAPAPGKDTLVRSDVDAGATVSVAVSGDGADIDVICAGERTCTLTLVKGG
ncbi:hypothetical protein [Dactylosporangium salmoneum]|uniref:DUF5666 domain-containing protein n=1 Tax=Dactylosporangium salmoneum TaxID=53361 RepID=A0ABP5V857_9ACTN